MIFNSLDYILFLAACFAVYWALPKRYLRNGFLLLSSYLFYGYVNPWLCFLLVGVTACNYLAALAIQFIYDGITSISL